VTVAVEYDFLGAGPRKKSSSSPRSSAAGCSEAVDYSPSSIARLSPRNFLAGAFSDFSLDLSACTSTTKFPLRLRSDINSSSKDLVLSVMSFNASFVVDKSLMNSPFAFFSFVTCLFDFSFRAVSAVSFVSIPSMCF
jgi:hypothetical protein